MYIKRIPFFGSVFAVGLVFLLNISFSKDYSEFYLVKRFITVYRFLSFKWGFDLVYNQIVNKSLFEGAYNTVFKQRDKGLLEFIGPTSAGRVLAFVGFKFTEAQLGDVQLYGQFRFGIAWLYVLTYTY